MTELQHFCHAKFCGVLVRPDLFMCYPHWTMVPADLRRLIWRHYRNGQELDKKPSPEYLEIAKKAQESVQKKEFEVCLQSHGSGCGCWSRAKFETVQGLL